MSEYSRDEVATGARELGLDPVQQHEVMAALRRLTSPLAIDCRKCGAWTEVVSAHGDAAKVLERLRTVRLRRLDDIQEHDRAAWEQLPIVRHAREREERKANERAAEARER